LGESTVEEAVAKLGQIFRENVGLPPYLWQVEEVIPPQPFPTVLRNEE